MSSNEINFQMKKTIIAIIIGIGLIGCEGKLTFKKKKADDEQIVVQYKEHFLTDKDIRLILPKDVSQEDSIKLVDAYIEEWVKKKAIVDKAEENIDALTIKEIDNKMVEYRQDLLINAYNNYLIGKNVENSVTEEEIYSYFEEHKESFPLTKTIVQFRGVTVNKEDAAEAERLFNSGKDEDFDELMKIVLISELPYHDKDSAWYSVEAMSAQFPQLNEGNYLNQLQNRRRVKMESESAVTLLRIINLKRKGSEAPYDFVKPTIKNLLLNKRKLNLLSDLQKELYKEAINNNQIKINEK